MSLRDSIHQRSEQLLEEIISIRRHLHQYPELSFQEVKTAGYICSLLEAWDIPYRKGIAGTGITAFIRGVQPEKKLVALRADMDALPIEEKNTFSFVSSNPGVMHACGHDAHMAALLGCARILKEMSGQFDGTVQLIFQPGEEKLPGGALRMMEEGLFSEREPDLIIAQHVDPELESGVLGFRPGAYMASTDELYFTVTGRGGHAAMPHKITDPVLIAAQIIMALQQIVSRKGNPAVPSVLSIGKVTAAGATNVIPDQVTMEGTFRTFNEPWRAEAHNLIRSVSEHTALAGGGSCECTILKGYPVLVNHPDYTASAMEAAIQYAGEKNVVPLDLRMTSEDFAWYSQKYPAVFYRFGIKTPGKPAQALHTAGFSIHEPALAQAMGAMAYITLYMLHQ